MTQEKLKELLHYSPETGIFTWLERPLGMFSHCERPEKVCNWWNKRFSGNKAGNKYKEKKSKTSYIHIGITLNGKTKSYLVHRLVFLYLGEELPLDQVDHIDGDGTNNKRNNLRKVSSQENMKNQSMYSNNTSGHVGVYWHKRNKKYVVQIRVNGKFKHGGYFMKLEDAISKRKEMEVEYGYHTNHGRMDKKESK